MLPAGVARLPRRASRVRETPEQVDAALEFIQNRNGSDAPWMVFLPLLLPHPPYSCPEPWYSMVDRASVQIKRPADLPGKPDYYRTIRNVSRLDQMPADMADETFREARAIYLGCIQYSDYLLGQVLDALDASGRANDTLVVFHAGE